MPQAFRFHILQSLAFLGITKSSAYSPVSIVRVLATDSISAPVGESSVLLPRIWIGAPSISSSQLNGVRVACGALRGREDAIQGERACGGSGRIPWQPGTGGPALHCARRPARSQVYYGPGVTLRREGVQRARTRGLGRRTCCSPGLRPFKGGPIRMGGRGRVKGGGGRGDWGLDEPCSR